MNISSIQRGVGIAALVLGTNPLVYAPPPAWWNQQGVLTQGAAPNDYAAANLGQVKRIATLAYNEMQSNLPGGAGPAITALVLSWTQSPGTGVVRNDYAAVNAGQLKALAKLFYDRLALLGFQGAPLSAGQMYPWTATTSGPNDFAAVNIGQVKYVFSFDITSVAIDGDYDGLPDDWERQYFGSITAQGAAGDPDGDGVTNLQEYLLGRNPTKGAVADLTGAVNLRIYSPIR